MARVFDRDPVFRVDPIRPLSRGSILVWYSGLLPLPVRAVLHWKIIETVCEGLVGQLC